MNRGTSEGSETSVQEGLARQIRFCGDCVILFRHYLERYFEKEVKMGHT